MFLDYFFIKGRKFFFLTGVEISNEFPGSLLTG